MILSTHLRQLILKIVDTDGFEGYRLHFHVCKAEERTVIIYYHGEVGDHIAELGFEESPDDVVYN